MERVGGMTDIRAGDGSCDNSQRGMVTKGVQRTGHPYHVGQGERRSYNGRRLEGAEA